MLGTPETTRKGTWTHATSADTSTITLAATTGVTHVIDFIHWSYAQGKATKGGLKITNSGSTTHFDIDLEQTIATQGAANSHGSLPFPNGIYGNVGEALEVVLEDNDSVSKLNVHSY